MGMAKPRLIENEKRDDLLIARRRLAHLQINGQPVNPLATPMIAKPAERPSEKDLATAKRVAEKVMAATLFTGAPSALKP